MKYSLKFYESVSIRAETTASKVEQLLTSIFKFRTMVDIGSGSGIWSSTFLKASPDLIVHAVDLPGTTFTHLQMFDKQVVLQEIDFEKFIDMPPKTFDVSICVEVVEHLTPSTSEMIMDYIAAHSKLAVFSGATPGQGGTHHINERAQEFWVDSMFSRGMIAFDVIRPILSGIKDVPSYYKDNIFLFVSKMHLHDPLVLEAISKIQRLENYNFQDRRSDVHRIVHSMVRFLPSRVVTSLANLKSKLRFN